MVGDLLVDLGQLWNRDLISKLFEYEDAKEIIKMTISHNNLDKIIWGYSNSGNFSIKINL